MHQKPTPELLHAVLLHNAPRGGSYLSSLRSRCLGQCVPNLHLTHDVSTFKGCVALAGGMYVSRMEDYTPVCCSNPLAVLLPCVSHEGWSLTLLDFTQFGGYVHEILQVIIPLLDLSISLSRTNQHPSITAIFSEIRILDCESRK